MSSTSGFAKGELMPQRKIENVTYNTDTARVLAIREDIDPKFTQRLRAVGKLGCVNEGLYVTRRGRYFSCTEYVMYDRAHVGGESLSVKTVSDFSIEPMSKDDAASWCRERGIEFRASDMSYGEKKSYSFNLREGAVDLLRKKSKETGLSQARILELLCMTLDSKVTKEDLMLLSSVDDYVRRNSVAGRS